MAGAQTNAVSNFDTHNDHRPLTSNRKGPILSLAQNNNTSVLKPSSFFLGSNVDHCVFVFLSPPTFERKGRGEWEKHQPLAAEEVAGQQQCCPVVRLVPVAHELP